MRDHPVHLAIEPSERFARLQLLIRLLAFIVLGMLGLSLGGLFVAAYLILPAIAAVRLTGRHDALGYLERDGPRLIAALVDRARGTWPEVIDGREWPMGDEATPEGAPFGSRSPSVRAVR